VRKREVSSVEVLSSSAVLRALGFAGLVSLAEPAVPIPSAYREPIRAFEGGDLDN
jgi:hypothetical protein